MTASTIGPIAPQERIQTIDIIRAVALFGVVVANFTVDNGGVTPASGRTGFLDQLCYWPIRFFIDDKAMAMYCFLFGLGFSIILLRTESRIGSFVLLHLRRMIALLVIGAIAVILTNETIPHEYAIVGLLLLVFYKLPIKLLPVLAFLCFIVPNAKTAFDDWNYKAPIQNAIKKSQNTIAVDSNILDSYVGIYQFTGTQRVVTRVRNNVFWGDVEGSHRDRLVAESETNFMNPSSNSRISFIKDSAGNVTSVKFRQSGIGDEVSASKLQIDLNTARKNSSSTLSYQQFVLTNAKNFWNRFKTWSWSDFFWGGDISGILSYFLIGLYAGRRRIFYDVSSNKDFLRKVMSWGLIVGFAGMSITLGFEAWNFINRINWTSYSPITRSLSDFSWEVGVMATVFAYLAGLTLLLEKETWKKRLEFLAPVGRMGLTNYLLHTIPYVILFHYGFNLSGQIGPFYRLLLALPVYVSLIFLSHWWFKHFKYGPFEWLWRSMTYLKFQPMRLNAGIKSKSSNEKATADGKMIKI
jgi:uncharacterized membrane protein YeiB